MPTFLSCSWARVSTFGIEEGLADEVVLDREAVRDAPPRPAASWPARGCTPGTPSGRGRSSPAGTQLVATQGQAAGVHRLLDRLAVDGVHERLAHADVVEGRLGHVDVEALLAARAPPVDDGAHLLDLVGEVGGDRLGVEQVEGPLLEADQLGGVLRHVEPVDLVDLRPAPVELVEGLRGRSSRAASAARSRTGPCRRGST